MSATPLRETEIIRMASLREELRISQINAHFRGDDEFILTAVVKGWSLERAVREKDLKQRDAITHGNTSTTRKAS